MTGNKRDEAFRQQVLTENLWVVLLKVCAPLALYQVLNQGFKILDTLMASHISSVAVSAVAYLSQINLMLAAIGGGLAVGGSIKISEAYGIGDYAMVRKRSSTLIGLSLALGLGMVCMIFPFSSQLLRLANTPASLIEIGKWYFNIEIAAMVVAFFNNVYIAIERVRGNTTRILVLNLITIAIKLLLTAWFVYGLGSSITGIAIASFLSQAFLLVAAVFYLRDTDSAFGFSWHAIDFHRHSTGPLVRISLPVMVERVSFSLGKVIINSMSGMYGALTVGALGISNNISGISNSCQTGLQEAAVSVISQNMAAGKPDRVLQAFRILNVYNLVIGAVGYVLTNVYVQQIAALFSNSAQGPDAAFQQMIVSIYRYDSIGGCIPLGVALSVTALLLGLGHTKHTLLINFSRLFLFRVPVLWALQVFTSLGSESVGIAMMLSNILVTLMSIFVAFHVIRKLKNQYSDLFPSRSNPL